MPYYNHALREAALKIVLFGAAHSGRSTTFRAIEHGLAEPRRACLDLDADDWSKLSFSPPVEPLRGLRVHVYLFAPRSGTEPTTLATSRYLDNVDAVIFVADAQASRSADNRAAFEALRRGLSARTARCPIVLQNNERDLAPGAPRGAPPPLLDACVDVVETRAHEGFGVARALRRAVDAAHTFAKTAT